MHIPLNVTSILAIGVLQLEGDGHNSVVEHQLIVLWVIGSIPPGGLTDLFLVPASAVPLVYQSLWDGAYEIFIAANQTE